MGWEGLYEVSSLGRVRSFEKTIQTALGVPRTYPARIMKPSVNKRGYSRLTLHSDGQKKYVSLYRLVCEAFHGTAPEGKPWALHRDGNPKNNKADNLYWGSPTENALDRVRHGNNEKANATSCPKGHPYDGENIYWRPDGRGRDCRTCRSQATKESKERRLASKGEVPHGTLHGYTGWDCRCDPCRDAYRGYYRKKRLLGEPPPGVPHGCLNAYTSYGCRCDLCRAAMSKYYRERRERGRSKTSN